MQAKLFTDTTDRKPADPKGIYVAERWLTVEDQINAWLAKNGIQIISCHFAAVSDPTNDGQLTHSALVFYERAGE